MIKNSKILAYAAVLTGLSVPSSYAGIFSDTLMSSYAASYNKGFIAASVDQESQAKAQAAVKKIGEEAIGFLSNDTLSSHDKAREFRRVMDANFDMERIGRFVLGKNWRDANAKQQREYQKLFNDLIVRIYSKRLDNYQGQQFEVTDAQPIGRNDILVKSYIIPPSGAKINVDWRMREIGGRYKVIDIIIEKVSMSLTQRSEFSSIIQRGGGDVEALLAYLRE